MMPQCARGAHTHFSVVECIPGFAMPLFGKHTSLFYLLSLATFMCV